MIFKNFIKYSKIEYSKIYQQKLGIYNNMKQHLADNFDRNLGIYEYKEKIL